VVVLSCAYFYSADICILKKPSSSTHPTNIDHGHIGLCATCGNMQLIMSDTGYQYYLCQLSGEYEAYPKYPCLPVNNCEGYKMADSILKGT